MVNHPNRSKALAYDGPLIPGGWVEKPKTKKPQTREQMVWAAIEGRGVSAVIEALSDPHSIKPVFTVAEFETMIDILEAKRNACDDLRIALFRLWRDMRREAPTAA